MEVLLSVRYALHHIYVFVHFLFCIIRLTSLLVSGLYVPDPSVSPTAAGSLPSCASLVSSCLHFLLCIEAPSLVSVRFISYLSVLHATLLLLYCAFLTLPVSCPEVAFLVESFW